MSGIIFFGILGIWFFVAIKLTDFFTSGIQTQSKKNWLYPLVLILVFIAPVMDEIIGGFQFRVLCETEAIATYDKEKVYGKTVYLESADVVDLTKMILPTYKQTWKYADRDTNEGLISYVDIRSKGGWLSRMSDYNSNNHSPYTFSSTCSGGHSGGEGRYIFQRLNIKKVNRAFGENNG